MSKETQAPPPSFEEALARLEQLVETMESGKLPLDDLIARFEEGTRLLKVCEERLKDAEMKIRQLKPGRAGVTLEEGPPATND